MLLNNKKAKIHRYHSGELRLLRSQLDKYIKNNYVQIVHENDYSFLELLLIIDYYINKNVKVDLVLTYLPYQRMDHKDRDELDTLNNMFNILNKMNINNITICEPHCNLDDKNVNTLSYVRLLFPKVKEDLELDKDDYVAFCDKGSKNRYKGLFKNTLTFEKTRNDKTGEIDTYVLKDKVDPSKKVLLVDDIISTGSTMIKAASILNELGVKHIYILCGHLEKKHKAIINCPYVKKIFTTNSLTKLETLKIKLFNVKDLLIEGGVLNNE